MSREVDNRPEVRMKSFVEMKRFKERWKKAVKDDRCWIDPYWNPRGLLKTEPNRIIFINRVEIGLVEYVFCGPVYTILLGT